MSYKEVWGGIPPQSAFLVCDCGAMVWPAAKQWHDQFHDHLAEAINLAGMGIQPGFKGSKE